MASRLLIKVGEREWPWDLEVTLTDAMTMKAQTGLGVLDFHNGVLRMDPDCCRTIVWMCRRRDEPNLKPKDVDFHFGEGGFSYEDLDDEVPTSEPSNPTAPNVTTPQPGTNGSTPSPDTFPALTSPL